jgi:hypothetical protein
MFFYDHSIQCVEINAQSDLTSWFSNENQIGNPLKILNRENYPSLQDFFQLILNSCFKCGVNGSLFLPNQFYSLLDRDDMLYKSRIKTMKILIRPRKNILKFTK